MSNVTVGTKAPSFTLPNTNKEMISLNQYQGKNVVLLFFPLAFTGVCTTELCNMRDSLSTYNNANAEVIAISVDSPFTLAKFKADNNLNFELLSDFNKSTSKAYDSLYEKFVLDLEGVSKRSAFVIDKDGIVQYAEINDDAGKLPDFEAIQTTLNNL